MKNRIIAYILFLVVALLPLGCQPEEFYRSNLYGDEELTISLSQGLPAAKAEEAKDGDVINNLYVWVTDGSSVVRAASHIVGGASSGAAFTMGSENKSAEVKFTNIERGDYTIYIAANLPASLNSLATVKQVDGLNTAELPVINTSNKPPYGGSGEDPGMPLSTTVKVSISAGNNMVEAELLRVCGRIRITVKNNTPEHNIFLQSLSLQDKNPSTGYLFHKDDHSVPAATTYTSFDAFSIGATTNDYIAPGAEGTYIDQYLYETGTAAFGGSLGFEIIGGLYHNSVTSASTESQTITEYEVGAETTSYESGKTYLIKNAAANYFLYNNSNTLSLALQNTAVLANNINANYLWSFGASSSPTTIKNLGNSRYLTITTGNPGSTSLGNSSSNVNISNETNGLVFYKIYNYGYDYYNQPYSNSGTLATAINYSLQTGTTYSWKLLPVNTKNVEKFVLKDPDKSFNKAGTINYLDQYGLPVPLQHICRNEDINIRINVFYNPTNGAFDFTVENWTIDNDNNDTTFD